MSEREFSAPSPSDSPDFAVQEIATILARGYLRLLARKAVPDTASGAPDAAFSLADFGERSPHGRRG
jgi:hypothetical protein